MVAEFINDNSLMMVATVVTGTVVTVMAMVTIAVVMAMNDEWILFHRRLFHR